MKIVCFIMAFLVLGLSLWQCADKSHNEGANKSTSAISKSAKQTDNPGDECSPFCHCTCCASFTINHFIPAINHQRYYQSKPTPAFSTADEFEIALPIWQPPQLV